MALKQTMCHGEVVDNYPPQKIMFGGATNPSV